MIRKYWDFERNPKYLIIGKKLTGASSAEDVCDFFFMVRLVTHSSVHLPKSGCCDCGLPGLALFVLPGDAQRELICLLPSVGRLCLHTAAGLKLAWTVGRTRRLCCDCSADTYCVSSPKRTEDKWGFAAICIKRFIHCKC